MNKTFTKEELTNWIAGLMNAAENDESFTVAWFEPTKNSPVSIVGGWQDGFHPSQADLFCMSESCPTYAMCIKIIENNGPYAYCDFETLGMPVCENGEVDDTCMALEWEDTPERFAEFFMGEWERMAFAIEWEKLMEVIEFE